MYTYNVYGIKFGDSKEVMTIAWNISREEAIEIMKCAVQAGWYSIQMSKNA